MKAEEEELLQKVKAIALNSKRLAQKDFIGDYKSAYRGSGMQFKEFRQYVYGDDVRHISWTVSARLQDPVLKTFEEERERTLFLVIDQSASIWKGPLGKKRSQRVAEIAATLAYSATLSNDNFGLLLFSSKVEKVIPAAKGRNHLLRIIREILSFKAENRLTNPNIALREADQYLPKHSIIFFISDFEVIPDSKSLRHCQSRHELCAIGIEDPKEHTWPKMMGFLEIETAERGRPASFSTWAESRSQESFLKRKKMASESLRKIGSEVLWLNTDEDYIRPLQNYFKKKGKR